MTSVCHRNSLIPDGHMKDHKTDKEKYVSNDIQRCPEIRQYLQLMYVTLHFLNKQLPSNQERRPVRDPHEQIC